MTNAIYLRALTKDNIGEIKLKTEIIITVASMVVLSTFILNGAFGQSAEQDYKQELLQQLDTECRDNYHSFCFGESWAYLERFLN
jgi:hypothetical protein